MVDGVPGGAVKALRKYLRLPFRGNFPNNVPEIRDIKVTHGIDGDTAHLVARDDAGQGMNGLRVCR